jgi:hypothetical protein
MASDLPENAFAHWMTPLQAVQLLDSVFDKNSHSYISKHTLLERLRGKMVRAVARTSARNDMQKREEFADIDPGHWGHVSETDIFWNTGDLTYSIIDRYERVEHRQFDVRFEPEAVRAIVAPAAKTKSVSPGSTASDTPTEEIQKGPAVSDAHLKAWFEVYRQVYPDGTEMHAWESARGMFLEKSVSRDRIRDLRGSQKRGPKGPRTSEAESRN